MAQMQVDGLAVKPGLLLPMNCKAWTHIQLAARPHPESSVSNWADAHHFQLVVHSCRRCERRVAAPTWQDLTPAVNRWQGVA